MMLCDVFLFVFFFFKQKTAYEMRISDWSSDVCSSDLPVLSLLVSLLILNSAWRLLRISAHILLEGVPDGVDSAAVTDALRTADPAIRDIHHLHVWQLASGSRMATVHAEDLTRVVSGTSVSVSVFLGDLRIITQKKII